MADNNASGLKAVEKLAQLPALVVLEHYS